MRLFQLIIGAVVIWVPAVAAAGQPSVDSPEPSLWVLLLLGAIPLIVAISWRLRRRGRPLSQDLSNK